MAKKKVNGDGEEGKEVKRGNVPAVRANLGPGDKMT